MEQLQKKVFKKFKMIQKLKIQNYKNLNLNKKFMMMNNN